MQTLQRPNSQVVDPVSAADYVANLRTDIIKRSHRLVRLARLQFVVGGTLLVATIAAWILGLQAKSPIFKVGIVISLATLLVALFSRLRANSAQLPRLKEWVDAT